MVHDNFVYIYIMLVCSDPPCPPLAPAKTSPLSLCNSVTYLCYTDPVIKKDLCLKQLESTDLGNNTFCGCLHLLITSLCTLLCSATAVQNMVALFLCPAKLSVLVHILLLGMENMSAEYSRLFCRIILLCIFHLS